MSEKLKNFLAGLSWLVATALLAMIVLGVTQCIQYDRWKERTCLNRGGVLMNRASPGAVDNRDACMKLEVQMSPIAIPGEP